MTQVEFDFTTTHARRDDPATSKAGARDASRRAPSQRMRLLTEYARAYKAGMNGLLDEEAADRAGMTYHAAGRRCSDMRRDGWIAVVTEQGQDVTRVSSLGSAGRVCAITLQGAQAWARAARS